MPRRVLKRGKKKPIATSAAGERQIALGHSQARLSVEQVVKPTPRSRRAQRMLGIAAARNLIAGAKKKRG